MTFNLGGGEASASRDVMDWTESETLLVPRLPRGRALWRVGEHGAIVQTILSPRDVAMCDSNQAMRSRPRAGHEKGHAASSHVVPGRCDDLVGLVAFGAVTALLPRNVSPRLVPAPVSGTIAGLRAANVAAQLVTAQPTAAQQVAVRFVTASDTTDPAQPEGNVAIETALAPGLAVPHVVRPEAWVAEDRRTTVVLDPPGHPVAGRGAVAVIVTGRTVTTDTAPPQIVPLDERILLDRVADDHSAGDRGGSGWRVVGVEVGA